MLLVFLFILGTANNIKSLAAADHIKGKELDVPATYCGLIKKGFSLTIN